MAKSIYVQAVDNIQAALRPFLHDQGYRVRGRTFNRVTEDRLTQVINIQMGSLDPPSIRYNLGLCDDLYGLFTINLGVYVPEVFRYVYVGQDKKGWIQDPDCCVRARIGQATGEEEDIWWHARSDGGVIDDVRHRLEGGGLPFLERFSTRDKILAEWRERSENQGISAPPRIVLAIILAERGEMDRARALLAQQALGTRNPGHADHVRQLAQKLGVGSLDS